MSFFDKRKERQRGRYKNTDFANIAEAKSFAAMGPLSDIRPLDLWDVLTQGIRLHEMDAYGDDYERAMKILKRTFG